jgi:long-subunit acyl-CoA synthetase (AMP-forming)
VEVRIADPDEASQGEIAIRGPNVMLGYYRKPQETAEVLRDGWFYTGDLGYRDKDGYFFITGRSKEMIVLSTGKKIFPEELEKFYKQIPSIKEICLIQGERGLDAAVVPDFDYLRKMNLCNPRNNCLRDRGPRQGPAAVQTDYGAQDIQGVPAGHPPWQASTEQGQGALRPGGRARRKTGSGGR